MIISAVRRIRDVLFEVYYKLSDPLNSINPKNTPLIPRAIYRKGILPVKPVRFLEIGPRWGQDARDWDRRISIKEMVFIDLPETKDSISQWIGEIKAPHKVIYSNVLHLADKDIKQIGKFDVVYCSGVIYHLAEQFRFCKILFDFLEDGGVLILESYVVKSRENVVKVLWPEKHLYSVCHHIPSSSCIKSWLEMIGFSGVAMHANIYPKKFKGRVIFTATKKPGASTPDYLGFTGTNVNNAADETGKMQELTKAIGSTQYIPINYLP